MHIGVIEEMEVRAYAPMNHTYGKKWASGDYI